MNNPDKMLPWQPTALVVPDREQKRYFEYLALKGGPAKINAALNAITYTHRLLNAITQNTFDKPQ